MLTFDFCYCAVAFNAKIIGYQNNREPATVLNDQALIKHLLQCRQMKQLMIDVINLSFDQTNSSLIMTVF